MSASSVTYLTQLHQLLSTHFNLAEFQDLCLKLNVDFETIPGVEKSSRMREFLLAFGRNGRLPEFVALVQTLRQHLQWPPIPDTFQLPESLTSADITPDGERNIQYIGDIIDTGDVSGSNIAIGAGAQVIANYILNKLSAAEEMKQSVDDAEERLARAILQKVEIYTRLLSKPQTEAVDNPYRSLLNYRVEDAPFFYGRQKAIQAMLTHLNRNRLTILQADSGSGKTSLIQAGLSARLLAAKHLPLYIRPLNEPPHQAIKRAFLPDYDTLAELSRFRDSQMSLQGFLRRVTSYLGPRKLFIFIDQFEEFFDNLTPEKEAFVTELQKCIDDPDLDVRWVLSLREEYFSKLLRLFDAVRPYENYYFLDTFHLDEAQEVITQPALKFDVTYSEGLVQRIIEDVADDNNRLVPVHVQLVCSALFTERQTQSNPQIISARLYYKARGSGDHKAPGAKGILRSHLSRTLNEQMSGQERKLAWRVLHTLVSAQKKRAQCSRAEIDGELQKGDDSLPVDAALLDRVLLALENSSLIRKENDDHDELQYELAHEYLLDEIEIDPQMLAIKLAQEILEQELFYYRNNGVLLAKDKYELVSSQRAHLHLDDASRELLEKSEVQQTRELREAQERERKTRQWLRVAVVLAVLTMIGGGIAYFYYQDANNARVQVEENAKVLQASVLASQAIAEEAQNPQLSLLLAVDSYTLTQRIEMQAILQNALDRQIQPVVTVISTNESTANQWRFPASLACWSADGNYFFTNSINRFGTTNIWNIEAALSGVPLFTFDNQDVPTKEGIILVSQPDKECPYDILIIADVKTPAWWDTVQSIDKSPNDSYLLFHAASGKSLVHIDDLTLPIATFGTEKTIHWSKDGSILMTSEQMSRNEYQSEIWDMQNLEEGRPRFQLFSKGEPILSTDGSRIAARIDEANLGIWDTNTGAHATIAVGKSPTQWIPQQLMLLIQIDFGYELWDVSNINAPELVRTITSATVPEWNADGEYFITWEAIGRVYLWQTRAADNEAPIASYDSQGILGNRWNRNGSYFLVWPEDGAIQAWGVQNSTTELIEPETALNIISGLSPGSGIASRPSLALSLEPRWAENGLHVEIPHDDESTTIWNIETNDSFVLYRNNANTSWQPGGGYFLATDEKERVELWDINTLDSPFALAEQDSLLIFGESSSQAAGDPYCDYESDSIWQCLWSSDRSKYLVIEYLTKADEYDAYIVNAATGEELFRLPEQLDPFDGGWRADNKLIWVSEGPGGIIYVLDALSGEVLFRLTWDGSEFALSNDLSQLLILNASTNTLELYLENNFQNPIWATRGDFQWAQFSTDDTHFLTLDSGNSVTVWETDQQLPLLEIDDIFPWSGFYEEPPPISLNLEAGSITVMKADGQIYRYPLAPELWIRQACETTARNLTWAEWRASFPQERFYHLTCGDHSHHETVVAGILREIKPVDLSGYFAEWKNEDETLATAVEQELAANFDTFLVNLIRQEEIATAVSLLSYGEMAMVERPIAANTYFELCLVGSLLLQAEEVMFACENAVELAPEYGPYQGARAIARLIMDMSYPEAEEDIRNYLEWEEEFLGLPEEDFGELDVFDFALPLDEVLWRAFDESWIAALENGENPLDRRQRSRLRGDLRVYLSDDF